MLVRLQVFGGKLKDAADGAVRLVALDCGCGVGRIAQEMLLHFCAEVQCSSAMLLSRVRLKPLFCLRRPWTDLIEAHWCRWTLWNHLDIS